MFQILLLGLCWVLSKAETCDYETDNYCLIEDSSATAFSLDDCPYEAGIFEMMDDWDELLAGLSSWDGEFYIGLFYVDNTTFIWANDVEGDPDEVPDDVNRDDLSQSSSDFSCVLLIVDSSSANDTFSLYPSDCNSTSDGYICTKMLMDTTGMPTQSPVTSSPTQSPATSSPTKNPTYTPPTKNPTYTPPTKNPTFPPPTASPSYSAPTKSPTTSDESLTFTGSVGLGLGDYSGDGDPCDDTEVREAVIDGLIQSYKESSGVDVEIEVEECSSQETTRRRLLQTSYELTIDFKIITKDIADFLVVADTNIGKNELETVLLEVISDLEFDFELTVDSVAVENCKNSNNQNCDDSGAAELSYFMSMLMILFGFYFW